jgi:glutamine synthetase
VHADLLRAAVADAGNDHRLGANEAPPAIVSVFLGEQLKTSSSSWRRAPPPQPSRAALMELGVTTLPPLPKDATDRNRTSPFAFTGNKFEFRAVGSSVPIYWPQTVLNTIAAESIEFIADKLDKLKTGDFAGLTKILSEGDQGAQARSLRGQRLLRGMARRGRQARSAQQQEHRGCPAGLQTEKAKKLFPKFAVLSERELESRVRDRLGALREGAEHRSQRAIEIAKTQILPPL